MTWSFSIRGFVPLGRPNTGAPVPNPPEWWDDYECEDEEEDEGEEDCEGE